MTNQDTGHENLILDIEVLLQEANDYAFHDFKTEKYALPKATLAERLHDLRENVKQGKYDN